RDDAARVVANTRGRCRGRGLAGVAAGGISDRTGDSGKWRRGALTRSTAIELVRQPPGIDIQRLHDVEDRVDRDAPLGRPAEDLQVFLADFDAIEDSVEQK